MPTLTLKRPEPNMSESAPMLLEARELVKRYAGQAQPALNGFSLTVYARDIFGLLGPNGAGKTTAIGILCSLLAADQGTVYWEGHRQDWLRVPWRRFMGLVPQEIALYDVLSVRENVAFWGRLYGLDGGHLEEAVAWSLDFTDLTAQADQRLGTLSGGMRRRANLAAGLVHRPRLLFLDEPTVGIDAQSRALILERLARLHEYGMTLIYTTHYMEEAQMLCTRLAIMDQGRMLVTGSPADLLAAHTDCNDLQALFFKLTGRQLRP